MRDTPDHVWQLYLDFFNQKTDTERFKMGFQMMEDGRRMVESALRQKHPEWSEAELKVGVFRRMYRPDFTPEKLDEIAQAYLTFLQTQAS